MMSAGSLLPERMGHRSSSPVLFMAERLNSCSCCFSAGDSQNNAPSSLLSSTQGFSPSSGPSFGWGMSHRDRNAPAPHALISIKAVSEGQQRSPRSGPNRWPLWVTAHPILAHRGLEVRGTAGMRRLNRGIGGDRTGPCMKESNGFSFIPPRKECDSISCPSPCWCRSDSLDAEALLQEMMSSRVEPCRHLPKNTSNHKSLLRLSQEKGLSWCGRGDKPIPTLLTKLIHMGEKPEKSQWFLILRKMPHK